MPAVQWRDGGALGRCASANNAELPLIALQESPLRCTAQAIKNPAITDGVGVIEVDQASRITVLGPNDASIPGIIGLTPEGLKSFSPGT